MRLTKEMDWRTGRGDSARRCPPRERTAGFLTVDRGRQDRPGFNRITKPRDAVRAFLISVDFPSSREENPPKLPTDVLRLPKFGMYQPPPLRARSVFDDKKVLLIDPHQPTRNARANVFRSHGVGVDATDSLQVARTLWRTKLYDLILLDARGYLLGEARDFYLEIKHASPHERVVFLVGPPMYVSLTWPTEFMAAEREPQQRAETV